MAAVLMLSVAVFVGIVTIGRVLQLDCEDVHSVLGMNRLRRAYLDMQPELEPHFLTGCHDMTICKACW